MAGEAGTGHVKGDTQATPAGEEEGGGRNTLSVWPFREKFYGNTQEFQTPGPQGS